MPKVAFQRLYDFGHGDVRHGDVCHATLVTETGVTRHGDISHETIYFLSPNRSLLHPHLMSRSLRMSHGLASLEIKMFYLSSSS